MTLPGKTLVDLYRRACEEYAEQPALGRRTNRGWVWRTYADLGRDIDEARGGLATLGVQSGDRVAICASNRAEWPALAVACYGLGAVVVPISEEASPAEWQVILNDSDATLVVGGSEATVDALEDLRDDLPRLEHVLGFGLPPEDPRSFAALCELGRRHPTPALRPAPDAIAERVYGDDESAPQSLTHAQLVANVRALQELLPVDPGAPARTVASLPWAHLLGRLAELHHGLGSGVAVAIHEAPAGLLADLAEIRPTRLTVGAALAAAIHQLVLQDVWQQPALAQRLFHEGLASMAERTAGRPDGLSAPLELFLDEESVFGRVRDRLGGRVDHVLCAGALAHEVAGVLRAMDLEVVEVDARSPIDSDGHLAVASGRVSYQLAGGSEVIPATIEAAIRQSPYIRDVIVVGAGQRATMALVVPDLEAIAGLAHRLGVPLADQADDAALKLLVAEELRQRLQGVLPALVPRRFALIDEPFTVENGLLTATLELRRERIAEVYENEIRALYRTPPPPPRPRRRTQPPVAV